MKNNKTQISKEFHQKKADYNRLGKNVVEALQTFLNEIGIPFLDIYYRVKKFDSFYEKISRKKYQQPFEEIEDICGIRIICYYASDIEKIGNVISKEFKIIEEEDKSDLLGLKEFAYRSKHFTVKINNSWLASPNYRKLDDLKCEIQVRTILMHAWAEIEHKLNYKSTAQVPNRFQRKLFRLSAKFEEADEQFEELKDGIDQYISQLSNKIEASNKFNLNQDFNIESFKLFIKYHFPDKPSNETQIDMLFNIITQADLDFKVVNTVIETLKPNYEEINKDLVDAGFENEAAYVTSFLWIAMDIYNNETFNAERSDLIPEWHSVVDKWRNKTKTSWQR